MLDTGEDPTLKQMSFDGTPINGTRIGTGPDTCWGRSNSFTYRADVTPFVRGNGTFHLGGVATGGLILGEGASLVVLYRAAGAPPKTVMLADGNVVFPAVQTGGTSFSGFKATGPVSAKTTFMVGDGQATQFNLFSPVSFTGSLGTLNLPGLFDSRDGLLWDTATFDVSRVVGSGSNSGSATIQLAGDCLLWSAQAFSVTSAPATPVPVTSTAAVVKTNATGDTAVDGRGVNPGDSPTLQDRIQMIVLNRVIEDRTPSPGDLTVQLVSSIPPSVLPPSQAASLLQAVFQNLKKSGVKMELFDTCLRDDSTSNLFEFNSSTGAYRFTRCKDGFTLSGTGSVRTANSIVSLTDTKPDRNVNAGFLIAQRTGRATVTLITAPGLSQTITISSTNPNRICSCGT